MFTFGQNFITVASITTTTPGLESLVVAKQTEISGQIDVITMNVQTILMANQDNENAKIAALKAQIVAALISTASCKAEEDAIDVKSLTEIQGVKDISDAKKAVLISTVTLDELNTFVATLSGLETQLDNLVISYKPDYILYAGTVIACYNQLLNN